MGESATGHKVMRADWFLLALLSLSLGTNVLLGVGFLRLSAGGGPQAAAPERRTLPIGKELPPLEAQRLGGGPEVIRYDPAGRPTLIYVFTPSCSWCARNLANFRALIDDAKDDYRIVGVSLDPEVETYLKETALDLPVYINASTATLTAYELGSTPQTIVVSPEGKVLKSWVGAYGGSLQKEVESVFGLRLPGLSPPAAPPRQGGKLP